MKRMFHPWENWLYRRFNPKIEGFYPLVEISGKGGNWFASLYCCPSDPLKNPLIEKPNPKKKQQSPYPEQNLNPKSYATRLIREEKQTDPMFSMKTWTESMKTKRSLSQENRKLKICTYWPNIYSFDDYPKFLKASNIKIRGFYHCCS